MFGWLKRKHSTGHVPTTSLKGREVGLTERLMRAHGEGQEIARLRRALATLGDVSSIFDKGEERDFVICGQAAAKVVKTVSRSFVSEHPDDEDDYRFTAGVWSLALANQISYRVGAPFEEAGFVACVELLGLSATSEFDVYIKGYNAATQSGRIVEVISKTFLLWLNEPSTENFRRMTELFKLTLDYVKEIEN